MSTWTEEIICVIPIAERDNMALLASKIMPDVNEGRMFDRIRLSITGEEPATHLMAICPLPDGLAGAWCDSFNVVHQYLSSINLKQTDKRLASESIKDARFAVALLARIENDVIRETKSVKLAYGTNLTIVTSYQDLLSGIGLVQIGDDGEP